MTKNKPNTDPTIDELAVAAFAEQGYLFQQAVLQGIKRYTEQQKAGWYLQDEEHPVSAGDQETVIDFVLGHSQNTSYSYVFECKRAHPDYVSWLFADSLIYREDREFRIGTVACNLVREQQKKDAVRVHTSAIHFRDSQATPSRSVNIGLEVQHGRRTGRLSQSRTIFDACNQVMTGVAGLVSEQVRKLNSSPVDGRWDYVPVIVTTAGLHLTTYNPSDISLEDGTIELSKTTTQPVPWVYYDFPTRPSLPLTPVPLDYQSKETRDLRDLKREFKLKSVIIVSGSNLLGLLQSIKPPGSF